jgi:hypothetical protein
MIAACSTAVKLDTDVPCKCPCCPRRWNHCGVHKLEFGLASLGNSAGGVLSPACWASPRWSASAQCYPRANTRGPSGVAWVHVSDQLGPNQAAQNPLQKHCVSNAEKSSTAAVKVPALLRQHDVERPAHFLLGAPALRQLVRAHSALGRLFVVLVKSTRQ